MFIEMSKKYLIVFYLFIGIVFQPISGYFIYYEIKNLNSPSTFLSNSGLTKNGSIIYGDMINVVLKKSTDDSNFTSDRNNCFYGQIVRHGECICNKGWYGKKCNIKKCDDNFGHGKNNFCMYVDNDEFNKIINIQQYREYYYYIVNLVIFVCLCAIVVLIIICLCGFENKKHSQKYGEESDHSVCKKCRQTKVCPSCDGKECQAPPQYSELF